MLGHTKRWYKPAEGLYKGIQRKKSLLAPTYKQGEMTLHPIARVKGLPVPGVPGAGAFYSRRRDETPQRGGSLTDRGCLTLKPHGRVKRH